MKSLSKEMKTLLFQQIGLEYSNCVAYWGLEWALREQAFKGMSKFMHEAGQDERHHAKKLAYWLLDRGEEPPLEVTNYQFKVPYGSSPQDIFQSALDLEKKNTVLIEALVTQSEDDNDPECRDFLSWYVEEQVDSENELSKIMKWLKKAGTDYAALMKIDCKLG